MALVHCPDCGRPVSDAAPTCPHCGRPQAAPPRPRGPRPHVPNHLGFAIFVTLCCCVPFGIVSIVYAAQVNSRLDAGDYDGARRASADAQKWAWISVGLGVVVGVLYLIVGLAGGFEA